MAGNAKELQQYTFKQRTEVYHKGERKNARVDEVHYSVSGERVAVPIHEDKAQTNPPRRGPGHRLLERKMEEEKGKMRYYVDRLMSLTSRYFSSNPAKFQAALTKAETTTTAGSSQVRIRMRDYVRPGDTMTMSFDQQAKRPTTTEVITSLDDAPVTVTLAFDQVHGGPSYPGKMIVRCESKEIEVRVFTYDYHL
jgi:hypothetical protein